MIESGAIVSLGLVMWFSKISWQARLKMLSHPLALDILVFVLLTFLHWGTFSGVMTAAVGSLITSLLISAGRAIFGYYKSGKYVRGYIDVSAKLIGV